MFEIPNKGGPYPLRKVAGGHWKQQVTLRIGKFKMSPKPNLTAKLRLSGLGSWLRVKSTSCTHRGMGVVPGTHVATHNYLELKFSGFWCSMASAGTGNVYVVHICIQAKHSYR